MVLQLLTFIINLNFVSYIFLVHRQVFLFSCIRTFYYLLSQKHPNETEHHPILVL